MSDFDGEAAFRSVFAALKEQCGASDEPDVDAQSVAARVLTAAIRESGGSRADKEITVGLLYKMVLEHIRERPKQQDNLGKH